MRRPGNIDDTPRSSDDVRKELHAAAAAQGTECVVGGAFLTRTLIPDGPSSAQGLDQSAFSEILFLFSSPPNNINTSRSSLEFARSSP